MEKRLGILTVRWSTPPFVLETEAQDRTDRQGGEIKTPPWSRTDVKEMISGKNITDTIIQAIRAGQSVFGLHVTRMVGGTNGKLVRSVEIRVGEQFESDKSPVGLLPQAELLAFLGALSSCRVRLGTVYEGPDSTNLIVKAFPHPESPEDPNEVLAWDDGQVVFMNQ